MLARTLTALILLNVGWDTQAQHVVDQGTVIEDVTLISPERVAPLLHADVVLRDGKIAEIGAHLVPGPHARQIDGSRRFLIPGLIDSHVHVGRSAALGDDAIDSHPELWAAYRAQVPRAYLAFGFTSIVDLDLTPRDRAWFDGTPLHPRLYSWGRGITVAGGYMALKVPPVSSPSFRTWFMSRKKRNIGPNRWILAATRPKARYHARPTREQFCVKAFVESGFGTFNWPHLHTETLQKIQAAARERKLVLMVHATSVDSWRSALDAHADIIAHGLWVWPGDFGNAVPPPAASNVIAAAAARAGTQVRPTFQTVAGERAMIDPSLLDDPRLTMALPLAVIA